MSQTLDKVVTMTTNTETSALNNLVNERITLKAEIDSLNERLKNLDEVVIEELNKEGLTKVETELGKVNLIQSNTIVWNEEVLQELLTTAQWNRISVRKLDKSRLDAEVIVGRIDETLVEVAKRIKQSKPFLR
jgi:hypothetical protein